jgi:phage repressor protein C with HTH and peptisase S24 domain
VGADAGADAERDPAAPADASAASGRRLGFAVVRGRSMLPTLAEGDRLLVRYLPTPMRRPLRSGRLVVCRPPDRPLAVKRLGRPVDGRWWVRSDNAGEGTDSATFGPLPDRSVVAVVCCRVWPHPSLLRRRT